MTGFGADLKGGRFLLVTLLGIAIAGFLPERFMEPITHGSAQLAGICLDLIGAEPVVSGDIITVDEFRVRIVSECTPLFVVLLFTAYVFSVPVSAANRFMGVLTAVPILVVVNTVRIALVTLVGARYPDLFEILHVYLGQIVMVMLVLGLAFGWHNRLHGSGSCSVVSHLTATVMAGAALTILWLPLNRPYVVFLDRIIGFVFARLGYHLIIPHQHTIYFQTFNVVLLAALFLVDTRMKTGERVQWILVCLPVLTTGHLLDRVANVMLTGFGWDNALTVARITMVTGQYVAPVLLWLWVYREEYSQTRS